MKKLLIIALCFPALTVLAQPSGKKPATKPAPKTVAKPSAPVLKNKVDSFSYAIGLSIANFYREQGIKDINSALVTKALADSKAGKTILTEEQVNTCIMNYMQEKKSEKSAGARKAGEAFLAENKKKPGVITTASGLQYQIIKEGTGPKPGPNDQVKVHYHGTLL